MHMSETTYIESLGPTAFWPLNDASSSSTAVDLVGGAWVGSTSYSVGTYRTNGGDVYVCTTAGTSASSGGPTGTGSGIADGSCVWNYSRPAYASVYGTVTFGVSASQPSDTDTGAQAGSSSSGLNGIGSTAWSIPAATGSGNVGDFTSGVWVNFTTSIPSYGVLIGQGTGSSTGWCLSIHGNKPNYIVNNSTSVDGPSAINDGSWHLLVMRRLNGVVTLSLDASDLSGTSTTFNGAVGDTSPMGILQFASGYSSLSFTGIAKKAFFFNGLSLTDAEVTQIYNDAMSGGGAATTATLSGPTSGAVSVPSTNFTVALDGTYTGTVTPASTGSGTFSPTSLSWSGSSTSETFTYTPTSTSGSPHEISISASPSLTIDGSPIGYTVTSGPTTIPVNDANVFYSPGNWYVNGSTYAQSNNPGAYIKTGFTGTSCALAVDVSTLVAGSVSAGSYPTFGWSIDDGPVTTVQLTSSSSTLTLATGLASGNHTLRIDYISGDFNIDRWTNPTMVLRITGIVVDNSASSVAPTLLPNRLVVFGDSITEGAYTYGATSPGGQDATQSFVCALALGLDAEYGIIGFSGQATGSGGAGGIPSLLTTWPSFDSLHSRLSGGHFLTSFNYVAIAEGTNGTSTSDMNTLLSDMRAAAPSATLLACVPFGGFNRSAISAATMPDSNSHVIDCGTDIETGLTNTNNSLATREAAAGPHPRPFMHGQLGSRLAATVKAAVSGGTIPSASDVRFGTSVGSTTGTLHVPTASQVLNGISVDATTGNVVLPATSNVRSGTTFGPSSSETGTLNVSGGSGSETLTYGIFYA